MTQPQPSTFTAIIKPLTECNLACTYCSVWEKKWERMPLPLMERILDQVSSYAMSVFGPDVETNAMFHGGEPLMMGLDYYEKALDAIKRLQDAGRKIVPSFQTNASLIDERYADFFQRNGCGLSISLDGPRDIHDAARTSKRGAGSYDAVIRGLGLLQERGLDPWVCTVLRKDSIDRLTEIYEHLRDLGIRKVYLLSLYPAGDGANVINDLGIPAEQWSQALAALFDRWCLDERRIPMVDPLSKIVTNLQGTQQRGCVANNKCVSGSVGFMPDGGVFPCAVLTGADPFFYGNIRTQDLGEIMQNSVRTRLLDRHQQLPQTCMDCPFISFCRGGCMHQSYTRNGSPYTFANYCEKELFVHIEQQLLVNGYFSPIDRRAIIARRLDSAGFVPYNNRSFLRKIGTPKTPTIQASGEEVKS